MPRAAARRALSPTHTSSASAPARWGANQSRRTAGAPARWPNGAASRTMPSIGSGRPLGSIPTASRPASSPPILSSSTRCATWSACISTRQRRPWCCACTRTAGARRWSVPNRCSRSARTGPSVTPTTASATGPFRCSPPWMCSPAGRRPLPVPPDPAAVSGFSATHCRRHLRRAGPPLGVRQLRDPRDSRRAPPARASSALPAARHSDPQFLARSSRTLVRQDRH